MTNRINLGDKVTDRISGYTGIAIARLSYLTGCDQIGIKAQGQKPDGSTYDCLYFDEPFVEMIERNFIEPVVPRNPQAGGPGQIIRKG